MARAGYVRILEIERPSLNNNTADAQRLEHALLSQFQIDAIRIPLTVLKTLPSRLRAWDYRTKAIVFRDNTSWVLVALAAPEGSSPVLGAAVDIGTTRIVISLVNLETGKPVCEKGFDNPQALIGPDVLTRIHHSRTPGGLEELHHLVIKGVNTTLLEMCREQGVNTGDIYLLAGAGNTAMTHLFLGIESFEMIKEPYIPCVNRPDTFRAGDLGLTLHPEAPVFLFPNIGAYFGGDLVAGILYSGLDRKDAPCIMVDVGTNAEIVVGSKDWLIACAGAAGPALEGGVSKMGMTAKPGVIDKVWIDPDTWQLKTHTIEDKKPIGICGSGMIDLAASLFLSGRIDIRGKFFEPACKGRLLESDGIASFVLVDAEDSATGQPICLSQVDMNSLTSAKAAMYTILEVIVKNTASLAFEDLKKFYVAGTFGSFINPVSAISIGMLPDIPVQTFEVLGNTSLGGAAQMLIDLSAYDRVRKIRQSITYIELNVNQEFMNLFSGAKFYPHTDRSRFPSVRPRQNL